MPPAFPNTEVKSVESWSNYTGTIGGRPVPVYCTPAGGSDPGVLRRHGDAVRAILRYCFTQNPPAPLRVLGSAWSFSRIVEPETVVLDPANFTYVMRVPANLFTPACAARAAQGFAPIFVEGGTQIGALNRRLANDVGLALQTTGAADGHRIAGCIATGTHGSAIGIGAVHDTVLGVYLAVSPDRALFVQSGSSPAFAPGVATWLEGQTGIPTENVAEDDAFGAALVSLGSLGVVLGVVVETVPLYQLRYVGVARPWSDPEVWNAIRTLDTGPLYPAVTDRPYHFGLVMHPYPPGGSDPGVFASLMWKTSAAGAPTTGPLPSIPLASSDLMSLIAGLTQALGNALTAPVVLPILQSFIGQQIASTSDGQGLPGNVFGPTNLPPGSGASTEIVVSQADAENALQVIYRVLGDERGRGHFLLGAIGVRFVPQTKALLGMNVAPMSCFIELPSIRNDDVLALYTEVWDALDDAGIAFSCHWGQLHGITPARLARYFGDRVATWKAARARLLDPIGQRVFAAPILAEVGLD